MSIEYNRDAELDEFRELARSELEKITDKGAVRDLFAIVQDYELRGVNLEQQDIEEVVREEAYRVGLTFGI